MKYRLASASTQLRAHLICETHKFRHYANKFDTSYLSSDRSIPRGLYIKTRNHANIFYWSIVRWSLFMGNVGKIYLWGMGNVGKSGTVTISRTFFQKTTWLHTCFMASHRKYSETIQEDGQCDLQTSTRQTKKIRTASATRRRISVCPRPSSEQRKRDQ